MPVVYDNWERLVESVLDREKLRQIALCPSFNSELSDFSSRFSFDSSLEDHVPGPGFPSNSAALSSLHSSSYSNQSSIENLPDVQPITFEEIKLATRNFRFLLGEGGFGHVYKGWIDIQSFTGSRPGSGTAIAVKKLNPKSLQGRKEWVMQLHYLGLLDHPNLVKLIAYCFKDLLLIYEYMENGSLENHLFGGEHSLSWASRINVAIDVAKGLTFLHNREIQVGHQNVKASNILLDSGFKAKLSGFSSARYINAADMSYISTRFGTYSFGALNFITAEKGDVFDFGVVLLELLSGRRAIDKTKAALVDQDLVKWATSSFSGKKLLRIIDKKLEGQYPQIIAYKAATLALRCVSVSVSPDPYQMPPMAEVLFSLEQLKAEQLRLDDNQRT